MSKRRFRVSTRDTAQSPTYPTLEVFDQGRREFLAQLGGTLLGASVLASGLAACGGRALPAGPDGGETLQGEPVPPDSRIDGLVPQTDVEPPLSGGAPPPPARMDLGPESTIDGDPKQPDARIDDDMHWAGGKPGPGAKLDGGSCPNP